MLSNKKVFPSLFKNLHVLIGQRRQGFNTTITKHMLCMDKNLCDDNIDNECLLFLSTAVSTEMKVHKHMTCNGGSKYNAEWCRHMTIREKCIRWASRSIYLFLL